MQGRESLSKTLMQSLFYPAVLGTMFVLTITLITVPAALGASICDLSLFFALALIGFFTLSFLTNHLTPAERYGGWAFVIDTCELVLVFIGFWALGFLHPQNHHCRQSLLYFVLAPIPVLEKLWNLSTKADKSSWLGTIILVIGLLFGGAIGYRFEVVNVLVLLGLGAAWALWWRRISKWS